MMLDAALAFEAIIKNPKLGVKGGTEVCAKSVYIQIVTVHVFVD